MIFIFLIKILINLLTRHKNILLLYRFFFFFSFEYYTKVLRYRSHAQMLFSFFFSHFCYAQIVVAASQIAQHPNHKAHMYIVYEMTCVDKGKGTNRTVNITHCVFEAIVCDSEWFVVWADLCSGIKMIYVHLWTFACICRYISIFPSMYCSLQYNLYRVRTTNAISKSFCSIKRFATCLWGGWEGEGKLGCRNWCNFSSIYLKLDADSKSLGTMEMCG